ncbi:plasmid partition protein ParG [Herbiconiux daphne]|uniref:Plasmid partition protein ParG n=1 Tax=Herbiconiux daphne TaxID=2970914 RepID=A0ABT2HB19_9MICO|nr:plasmid partition protein ParG [Herbiconiux daphne]MCS5737145.1 plasmid partition protein ParG [Herbiconiux daphne]
MIKHMSIQEANHMSKQPSFIGTIEAMKVKKAPAKQPRIQMNITHAFQEEIRKACREDGLEITAVVTALLRGWLDERKQRKGK